jgi:hypothetical protein
VGWPPERVAALAAGLPAVTRARVPVRFGHASDLVFQEDGAIALLRALPHDRAAMLLTRFPVSVAVARAVASHPGALLHLSLAPPAGSGSKGARDRAGDLREALVAAAAVPPEQLFVLFGPLVEGSAPYLERLLPLIPRGAAVGFKPLAVDGLPFASAAPAPSAAALTALAAHARALGLDVPPLAGCRLRSRLRLPFFRYRELVPTAHGGSGCDACPTKAVCAGVTSPSDESLGSEAAELGLTVLSVHREEARVVLEVDAPAARADEVFLSERFGWPVYLSTVARAEEFRVVELSAELFERWERQGIYPATALRRAAGRMGALL